MLSKKTLQQRSKYIGSSDTSIIMREAPESWGTIEDLWYEKKGVQRERDTNADIERGNLLEAQVARMYRRKTGWKAQRNRDMIVSSEYPWMSCIVDYWTYSGKLVSEWLIPLELKCPRYHTIDEYHTEGIPAHYVLQLHHQMIVAVSQMCRFYAFNFENMEEFFYEMPYDPELGETIINSTKYFHGSLSYDTFPEMLFQEQKNTIDFYDKYRKREIKLEDPDAKQAVSDWLNAEGALDFHDQKLKDSKGILHEELGDNMMGVCDGYRIKRINRKGHRKLDLNKLKLEHPEIDFDQYYKQGPSTTYLSKSKIKVIK